MPIQLTQHAEAINRQKVSSGRYPDAEMANETAMRLLEEHDLRMERLRGAIASGENGEALPWTPELMAQLNREADEMQRRGESPNPDVCP